MDLDAVLMRLAQAPTPASLDGIEDRVLARIAKTADGLEARVVKRMHGGERDAAVHTERERAWVRL